VEAAYFTLADLPIDGTPEQGRYAFPAIIAVAALLVGGFNAFGRRWATRIATASVAAMIGFAFACQWLTLTTFFS
jgi:hypothetical protein